MPNHVTNRVAIIGTKEVVTALMKQIGELDDVIDIIIDFNKIKQMPPELLEVRSPCKILTEEEFIKEQKEIEARRTANPDDFMGFSHNLTKKMYDDYMERFGSVNWYDWSTENWGTKWNAYSQEMIRSIDENSPLNVVRVEFQFETAWSTPYKILTELSKQYPDVLIKVSYADEDAGYNLGKYDLKNGELLEEWHPEGDKESMDFYFEVRPDMKEYYKLENDEWVYKED